ncbi:uncharacterized protein A4U43_C10F1310 [Asparagus officinalis]|uniref:ACT domain-containing protein n=1 Tax=Asparagus officinalis TaxID=4686 RepID=A0A5P1DZR0_ASPOF|nr:uncharacterized protein A4U43_C10F1310 [Asparagus officinalis]
MEWTSSLDEYQKLVIRMNTPRRQRSKHGPPPPKRFGSYRISPLDPQKPTSPPTADGSWTPSTSRHHLGRKLADDRVIAYLEAVSQRLRSRTQIRFLAADLELTALELTGTDRLGLLSRDLAVLADLRCSIVEARVGTGRRPDRRRYFLKDVESGSQIEGFEKDDGDNFELRNVLNRVHDLKGSEGPPCLRIAVGHADRDPPDMNVR